MGRPTQRSAEMRRIVEEYESSGLTRREYCQQRGIALSTLDYWRREHCARPRLVKVEVAPAEPAGSFTLSLANGRRIEGSWRFSDGDLARLIRIAESV